MLPRQPGLVSACSVAAVWRSLQDGGAGGRCRYSGRWCRIHPAGSRRAVANTDMMKKLCCEEHEDSEKQGHKGPIKYSYLSYDSAVTCVYMTLS